MPLPCSIDLHGQRHQVVVARTDVAGHCLFREKEGFIAPGRSIEKHGERRVTLFRLLPYTASAF